MAKKSNFLKNLLTTASILAISAGALEASATGDARTTTGTPALQNGTNLDKNAAKANVPFAPDSTLTFFSNHTFNAINGIPIAAVTVNANAISTVQALFLLPLFLFLGPSGLERSTPLYSSMW